MSGATYSSSLADPRAAAFFLAEPGLQQVVELARSRVAAREVWLFGSRARGDATSESDWDIFLVLPDDAPDRHLEPVVAWKIGRDAGLVADIVAEREADVRSSADTVNTLAFALPRDGIRLG